VPLQQPSPPIDARSLNLSPQQQPVLNSRIDPHPWDSRPPVPQQPNPFRDSHLQNLSPQQQPVQTFPIHGPWTFRPPVPQQPNPFGKSHLQNLSPQQQPVQTLLIQGPWTFGPPVPQQPNPFGNSHLSNLPFNRFRLGSRPPAQLFHTIPRTTFQKQRPCLPCVKASLDCDVVCRQPCSNCTPQCTYRPGVMPSQIRSGKTVMTEPCNPCKQRKLRCDKKQPCDQCTHYRQVCLLLTCSWCEISEQSCDGRYPCIECVREQRLCELSSAWVDALEDLGIDADDPRLRGESQTSGTRAERSVFSATPGTQPNQMETRPRFYRVSWEGA